MMTEDIFSKVVKDVDCSDVAKNEDYNEYGVGLRAHQEGLYNSWKDDYK
ncbi:hypothetical protein KAI65_01400 [Candidatus Parcubacteria bacterium]|nr:hypothetical protein [Candidatus Parcubacteria bacterium]